jgi:hypothetical protein
MLNMAMNIDNVEDIFVYLKSFYFQYENYKKAKNVKMEIMYQEVMLELFLFLINDTENSLKRYINQKLLCLEGDKKWLCSEMGIKALKELLKIVKF